ncbi:MAG: thioredoxin family protein [bacterium]|jgi:thiol:disulfide interchange protein DsbD
MRRPLLVYISIFLAVFSTIAFANPVRLGHVEVALLSETEQITAGKPFGSAIHFKIDDGWHLYWKNPGDAGAPPSIEWQLPDGFTAGEIHWPYPHRIDLPPLTDFGYDKELTLLVEITPPSNLPVSRNVELRATIDWLVCKEICIPGETEVRLELPAGSNLAANKSANHALFASAREKLPIENEDWEIQASMTENELLLSIGKPNWVEGKLQSVLFFPEERGIIVNSARQIFQASGERQTLRIPRDKNVHLTPERLKGILVAEPGWRGPGSERALKIDIPIDYTDIAVFTKSEISGIWMALLFAFLGGMILNLMPCVLPVLSLKVLGIVSQAEQGRRKSLWHGSIFAAGVIASFLVLAGILLILQAGGNSLGWGFQLQSPAFVFVLASFLFLFALNLMGLFEIGPVSFGRKAGVSHHTSVQSFLNGVTATVVATPCTAPFMGSALGYSLSQPPLAALLIFAFLGAGMAFPYIVLSAFPQLLRFLPKPGRWMVILKHFMGFLLLGTVVWLASVLNLQAGGSAVVILLLVFLILALAAWIKGQWGSIPLTGTRTFLAATAFVFLITFGVTIGLYALDKFAETEITRAGTMPGGLVWENYSAERLAQLRDERRPILIDFTAAWCLSCQVNKRVALENDDVVKRLAELNLALMRADWTRRDDNITYALAQYGRNSVPLYVLYTGKDSLPQFLPEILTPQVVLDALAQIEDRSII